MRLAETLRGTHAARLLQQASQVVCEGSVIGSAARPKLGAVAVMWNGVQIDLSRKDAIALRDALTVGIKILDAEHPVQMERRA